MHPIRLLSVTEQTAAHLRKGLDEGRWSGRLPGVVRLAAACDVSTGVLRAALRQLEAEGLLSSRGLGRSRDIIAASAGGAEKRPLRVAILRHDARCADNPQTSLVLTGITQSLEAAGHQVCICKNSQLELKHDIGRMTRQLTATPADAWVIEGGSRELLEWCVARERPCLALHGRCDGLPLASAGPDLAPACRAATRQLIALGHRRIILIVGATRRKPDPGSFERAFLGELAAAGIPTGDYNLPDWEETPKGFHRLLETLFQRTPPTALIIDEIPRLLAVVAFLARHRIQVPEQVSLVATACDASLDWCHPPIAHMRWDDAPIIRCVLRWVDSVRRGQPDRRVIQFPAAFVPGASIGPPRKGSR